MYMRTIQGSATVGILSMRRTRRRMICAETVNGTIPRKMLRQTLMLVDMKMQDTNIRR